jgi:hypothetical protein
MKRSDSGCPILSLRDRSTLFKVPANRVLWANFSQFSLPRALGSAFASPRVNEKKGCILAISKIVYSRMQRFKKSQPFNDTADGSLFPNVHSQNERISVSRLPAESCICSLTAPLGDRMKRIFWAVTNVFAAMAILLFTPYVVSAAFAVFTGEPLFLKAVAPTVFTEDFQSAKPGTVMSGETPTFGTVVP